MHNVKFITLFKTYNNLNKICMVNWLFDNCIFKFLKNEYNVVLVNNT